MVKTITEQEAVDLLKEFAEKRSKEDQRALCCLLGAYSGDNLGNYNEFSHSITKKELEEAMKMPGYGAHNLIPGQSTDDTELATSMGYGLIENPDPKILDTNLISKYYSLWLSSPPFDLGMTIGAALGINRQQDITFETTAEECKKVLLAQRNRYSTKTQNRHSQSNGGVMRISPLCVYLSKHTNQETIRRIVYAEQTLTHIAKPSLEAAYVYVRIVTNLIRGLTATEVVQDLTQYFKNECKEEEVKEWWDTKLAQMKYDKAVLSMGWIKHALTQCFVVLHTLSQIEKENEEDNNQEYKKEVYKSFLAEILNLCGDSDTNGAIVGGMVGAYLTLAEFPSDYLQKIVQCNLQDKSNTQLVHDREEIYNPRNCIYLCDRLLEKASNFDDIEIIDGLLTDEIINEIKLQNEEKVKEINKKYYEKQNESTEKAEKTEKPKQSSLIAFFKKQTEEKKALEQQNEQSATGEIKEHIEEEVEQGKQDSTIEEEESSAQKSDTTQQTAIQNNNKIDEI